MSNAAVVFKESAGLQVTGPIHFNNVVSVFESALPYMNGVTSLAIDFKEASAEDSAILTLLTSWMRAAHSLNVELHYHHLNARVLDLLRVCGLENIIITSST